MTKKISYIFVLLAALLWGSTAAVSKLLLAELAHLQILFFSDVFAFFSLLCIILLQKKQAIIRTYTKRDYFTFAWMGFLGTFFYNFLLLKGIELLSAQEAFIINYLWPIMVVIFAAIFLKEHITWRKIFAIICSFFGIVIVIMKGDFRSLHFDNLFGVLSAALGAVVWGLFSVLGKKQKYEEFTSMMMYYFFGTFFALAAMVSFSNLPSISWHQLAGLIWFGAFLNGFAFVLWFSAIRHGDTAKISNIIFLTPFLSLVYIYFLTGEKILASSIIGLTIIIFGIMVSNA